MSSMQELEYLVRKRIGQNDPINSRWPSLLDFLNYCVEKVCFDTKDLKTEYTDDSIINQEEYVLPEETLCVHWVEYDGLKVYKRDRNWLSEHYPGFSNYGVGKPQFYYHKRTQDHLKSIGLFWKPDTADKVIRIGLSRIPTPITDPEEEPQISKAYHRFLIPLCSWMCMDDLGNDSKAKEYMSEYKEAMSTLEQLSMEADDDGPIAFSPGNPLVTSSVQDLNTSIRFWL